VATLTLWFVAACGGSSGGSQSTDTDAPVQDVVADAAAAEAALLTLADFPAGWTEVPQEDDDALDEKFDERVSACFGPDSDDLIESETEAATGNFTDPVDESSVEEQVGLAPTVESAEAYMVVGSADGVAECLTTAFREGFADLMADGEEMQGAELGEITIGDLDVGEIGDDSFAYLISIPISVQGVDVEVFAVFVGVRVGRSVAALNFLSQFDPTPIERITEYATLAASRLPG
jgi:hypothetical protein